MLIKELEDEMGYIWPEKHWGNTHAEKREINPLVIMVQTLQERGLEIEVSEHAPDPCGGYYQGMIGIFASPEVQRTLDQVFKTDEVLGLTRRFWNSLIEPEKEPELEPTYVRSLVEQVVERELGQR